MKLIAQQRKEKLHHFALRHEDFLEEKMKDEEDEDGDEDEDEDVSAEKRQRH